MVWSALSGKVEDMNTYETDQASRCCLVFLAFGKVEEALPGLAGPRSIVMSNIRFLRVKVFLQARRVNSFISKPEVLL